MNDFHGTTYLKLNFFFVTRLKSNNNKPTDDHRQSKYDNNNKRHDGSFKFKKNFNIIINNASSRTILMLCKIAIKKKNSRN